MPSNHYHDYLNLLPSDWKEVPVDALGEITAGRTPSRAVPKEWDGSIPRVTPGELTQLPYKRLAETRERITQAGLAASAAKLLPRNSLLVTTRATIGEVAIADMPVTTNQGFKSLIP